MHPAQACCGVLPLTKQLTRDEVFPFYNKRFRMTTQCQHGGKKETALFVARCSDNKATTVKLLVVGELVLTDGKP